MAFMLREKKIDLIALAQEFELEVNEEMNKLAIQSIILGDKKYDEENVRALLEGVVSERKEAEERRRLEADRKEREEWMARQKLEIQEAKKKLEETRWEDSWIAEIRRKRLEARAKLLERDRQSQNTNELSYRQGVLRNVSLNKVNGFKVKEINISVGTKNGNDAKRTTETDDILQRKKFNEANGTSEKIVKKINMEEKIEEKIIIESKPTEMDKEKLVVENEIQAKVPKWKNEITQGRKEMALTSCEVKEINPIGRQGAIWKNSRKGTVSKGHENETMSKSLRNGMEDAEIEMKPKTGENEAKPKRRRNKARKKIGTKRRVLKCKKIEMKIDEEPRIGDMSNARRSNANASNARRSNAKMKVLTKSEKCFKLPNMEKIMKFSKILRGIRNKRFKKWRWKKYTKIKVKFEEVCRRYKFLKEPKKIVKHERVCHKCWKRRMKIFYCFAGLTKLWDWKYRKKDFLVQSWIRVWNKVNEKWYYWKLRRKKNVYIRSLG